MPTPGRKRLRGAGVLALALLLAGCGATDTAAPSPAASSTGTAAPTSSPPVTTTASPQATAADTARIASGPSFGVDRAEWPTEIKDVRPLLSALPKELADETRELNVDPRDEGSAGAHYGRVVFVEVSSEEHQEADPSIGQLRAYQLLQAGFGIGAVCAKNTYQGTVPVPVFSDSEEEPFLAEPEPAVSKGSKPGWFSCAVHDNEDAGYAVGWTSGKTAWRVFARDERTARTLVTALHNAASTTTPR